MERRSIITAAATTVSAKIKLTAKRNPHATRTSGCNMMRAIICYWREVKLYTKVSSDLYQIALDRFLSRVFALF